MRRVPALPTNRPIPAPFMRPTSSKPLSPLRRWARIAVWVLLPVVTAIRMFMPAEYVQFQHRRGFEARMNPRHRPYVPAPPQSELPTNLWRIEIEVAEEDADRLRGYFWQGWNGGNGQERPQVMATVREGGVTYTNVALHLKGSAGSFQPFDHRPAMTLNFNKHVKGQKFHGLSKISLNNSVQDPSYLCEAISRELFNAAGIATPSADHATVILNGRDLRLYVVTEGWGKPMLRRHFRDVSGNLYEGGFLQDINSPLEIDSGDGPESRADLQELARATRESDRARRWERMGKILDLDRFATFLDMEVMTCHWDGYAMNRNNYRIFHDNEKQRLVFLPHGMDQMFGTFRSSPDSSIQPQMEGMVAEAFMGMPEGRKAFLARVAELRQNLFDPVKLTNRVMELSARIRPTLVAYDPALGDDHDYHVAELCSRIVQRAESITRQLANPVEPLQFTGGPAVALTNWTSRITSGPRGRIGFTRTAEEGKDAPLLQVRVADGGGAGSWRTRVLLEQGSYSFEGRARVVEAPDSGGLCLRMSGFRSGYTELPPGEWANLSFELTVSEPMAEVELVAEFAGDNGLAEFDLSSLRLVRR